jgi:hypothetical protein
MEATGINLFCKKIGASLRRPDVSTNTYPFSRHCINAKNYTYKIGETLLTFDRYQCFFIARFYFYTAKPHLKKGIAENKPATKLFLNS